MLFRYFIFFVILILYSVTIAQDTATNYIKPITTPEEALKRALTYTGFERLKYTATKQEKYEKVQREVFLDTTGMFDSSMSGHTVWKITFDSLYVDLSGLSEKVITLTKNQRVGI